MRTWKWLGFFCVSLVYFGASFVNALGAKEDGGHLHLSHPFSEFPTLHKIGPVTKSIKKEMEILFTVENVNPFYFASNIKIQIFIDKVVVPFFVIGYERPHPYNINILGDSNRDNSAFAGNLFTGINVFDARRLAEWINHSESCGNPAPLAGRLSYVLNPERDMNGQSVDVEIRGFNCEISPSLSASDRLRNRDRILSGFSSNRGGSIGLSGQVQSVSEEDSSGKDKKGLVEGIVSHFLSRFVHPLLSSKILQFSLLGTLFAALTGLSLGFVFDNVNRDRPRRLIGYALICGCGTLTCIFGFLLAAYW